MPDTRKNKSQHQQHEGSPKSHNTHEIFKNEIEAMKLYLTDLINKQRDNIINELKAEINSLRKENKSLKTELSSIRSSLKSQEEIIYNLEKDLINHQQYSRRNNIEIVGIPEEVTQEQLENKVIEIAKCANIKINNNDIEACHRLKKKKSDKGPARTIVRFTNRKHSENFHRNKKSLKLYDLSKININNKLFINCNLSPYNSMLWGKCKKLFVNNLINRYWVFNGHLNINYGQNDPINKKIEHLDDLIDIFPGFDFEIKS